MSGALRHDMRRPLEASDWLTIPPVAAEMTAGEVFHDGLGTPELAAAGARYYPRDVWLYLLASGWQRLGQEEHLCRARGQVGDELARRSSARAWCRA